MAWMFIISVQVLTFYILVSPMHKDGCEGTDSTYMGAASGFLAWYILLGVGLCFGVVGMWPVALASTGMTMISGVPLLGYGLPCSTGIGGFVAWLAGAIWGCIGAGAVYAAWKVKDAPVSVGTADDEETSV